MSFPLTAATDRLVDTGRFLHDVGVWFASRVSVVFVPAKVREHNADSLTGGHFDRPG